MESKGFWNEESEKETSLAMPANENYYHEVSSDNSDSKENKDSEDRYYEVFDKDKPKYIIWSLISAILGAISVLCAFFGWGGLIIGAGAVAFAIVSRVNLKYFDKISIVGLILGIFGMVFGAAVIIVGILVKNGTLTDYYVQKNKNGEDISAVEIGDGPIDAAFKAIDKILGTHYELDDFQVQSVTEGKEALGSALVRLRNNGKLYSGNGTSTDIVAASIRAYINALNKIVFEEA